MSRDVANPLILPRFSVFGGRDIVSGQARTGLEVIAQSVQSAYEQEMGDCVDDQVAAGGIDAPLYYRIKNMRRDGEAHMRVGVRVSSSSGASGSVAIDGGTPASLSWAAGATYLEAADDLRYDDSAEYSDLAVTLSGDVDTLWGCRATDTCERTELPAGPYTATGLYPLEAGRYLPGSPISVARTQRLCAVGRHLYSRMAGQILATADAGGIQIGTRRIQVPTPLVAKRGGLVHTAKLYAMGSGTVTITTSQGTYTLLPWTALGTWSAAQGLSEKLLEEGATPAPSVAEWDVGITGDIYAVSCYWADLPTEAYP